MIASFGNKSTEDFYIGKFVAEFSSVEESAFAGWKARHLMSKLLTTTEVPMKTVSRTRIKTTVSPGELLWHEFMEPMGISRYRLAKEIGIPAQRVGDIILGKRAITVDTALRLSRYFGLSDEYWVRAQWLHDLSLTKSRIESELEAILPVQK